MLRHWRTLGALPGSPPAQVVEHAQALAPLLGPGAPGRYSREERAAVGLAAAGFPCPALPEVVFRLGRWDMWANLSPLVAGADERPPAEIDVQGATITGRFRLSAVEANGEQALTGTRSSPVWGQVASEAVARAGEERSYAAAEDWTALLMGGQVRRDDLHDLADMATFAGTDASAVVAYASLMRSLCKPGQSPLSAIAELVQSAAPEELVPAVRGAIEVVRATGESPAKLDTVCHGAGHVLVLIRTLTLAHPVTGPSPTLTLDRQAST